MGHYICGLSTTDDCYQMLCTNTTNAGIGSGNMLQHNTKGKYKLHINRYTLHTHFNRHIHAQHIFSFSQRSRIQTPTIPLTLTFLSKAPIQDIFRLVGVRHLIVTDVVYGEFIFENVRLSINKGFGVGIISVTPIGRFIVVQPF